MRDSLADQLDCVVVPKYINKVSDISGRSVTCLIHKSCSINAVLKNICCPEFEIGPASSCQEIYDLLIIVNIEKFTIIHITDKSKLLVVRTNVNMHFVSITTYLCSNAIDEIIINREVIVRQLPELISSQTLVNK